MGDDAVTEMGREATDKGIGWLREAEACFRLCGRQHAADCLWAAIRSASTAAHQATAPVAFSLN